MKKCFFVVLFLSGCAGPRAVERHKLPTRVCVKWSKDIPEAQATGESLFSSVTRVPSINSSKDCDVVIETEEFGVGWLMSAYMKESVLSPCGKKLGRYSFRYKGDQWQSKLMIGLYDYLSKHPEAGNAGKDCDAESR
jgi:hypothetical protein